MPRLLWVVLFAATTAGPVAADAPSPLDLVRGLRENGMPDLALEYLGEIEKANPPADVRTVLPLERAKVQLLAAQQEPDDAARDAAVAAAKGQFQKFLKDNPKHPRAGEASVALGRVVSIQAKSALVRSYRQPVANRKAAAAATRPLFREAAKLFGDGAKATAALIAAADGDPARKAALSRESYQAELERGINQFNLADTYIDPEGADVTERSKALDDARTVFRELGAKDTGSSVCWAAKAWAGACEIEKQDRTAAETAFRQLREDAKKFPAAADGVRMAEFFELQQKFLQARSAPSRPALGLVRTQAADWLARDKYKTRATPERLSATYYYAHALSLLGQLDVVFEPTPKNQPAAAKKTAPKIRAVPQSAKDLLTAANREYKKLLDSDNEYLARAGRERTVVIRLLVGDPDQPPAKFTDFEQCQMAALVQLAQVSEQDEDGSPVLDEAGQKDKQAKAVALLERCRQLASTAPSPKDAADAGLQLAYAYLTAGRPHQAAVLGEYLTATARQPSAAAKGGLLAVQGYLAAMEKLPAEAEDAKLVDRTRAVELATRLDKTFPTDPTTDAVRFRLGKLLFDEKDYRGSFDTLVKVTPGYAGVSNARTVQARAAYALVVLKDSPLTPAEKAKVFAKAVADIEAVPEPAASATSTEARVYLAMRTVLAQLHIANPPDGYAKAEQVATAAVAKAATFTNLEAGGKKAAGFAAEEVRLRAVYAQAVPLYKDGKFGPMAEKLAPSLKAMNDAGPANPVTDDATKKLEGDAAGAADALDKFRREVVVLALQGKIREGNVEQAGELFGLLEKLGGTAEATAEALTRLVGLVRPQVEELRKQNKADEADKLAKDVTALLEAQAGKPGLSARVRTFLGRSLRELGSTSAAVGLLSKIEAPAADDLKKPTATLDPKVRETVGVYQVARLELARAYRLGGQYDEADKVLVDALGADGKSGWARSLDFRKEVAFLAEDRANAAPAGEKLKLWSESLDKWTRLVSEYRRAAVTQPKEPEAREKWERDRARIVPIYLGLFCDMQRCLARANSQIIADAGKRDAKLAGIGKTVAEMEATSGKFLTDELKTVYAKLLADFPAVKAGYTQAGGKAFAE